MSTFHFISGLPRSGSTLLSAILSQNPRLYANMSGPVALLVKNLLEGMAANSEYSTLISDAQRRRILRGVFEQYYGEEFTAEVIIDTHRMWCSQMPLLQMLFPGSKLIACVRETGWIVDSIEQLVRRNALSPSSIFNYQIGGTVYSRVDGVAGPAGMLGYAYNALKEAFYGEHAGQLLLVQYETLATDPQKVLNTIYDFLGLAPFAHDFDHITFNAEAFDIKAGTPGLHTVRAAVSLQPRQTVLPPDIFQRFERDAFWRDPQCNPHHVRIV
jgi:sulfotransferase